MRSHWTLDRTKAIVASLAGVALLTGPVIADKSAFAENTDEVAAMDSPTYLIQPSETHPGYMLPPLSDHLTVAQLNDDQLALEEKNDEAALEEDDGTAKEYNRGYYTDPCRSSSSSWCPLLSRQSSCLTSATMELPSNMTAGTTRTPKSSSH